MSVEVRHLRALVAIADHGGFSAAADELRISQPVVSRTIQQLESLVGRSLVDRSTRRVELTRAGEALAEDARGLLAQLDGAIERAAGQTLLRVGFHWVLPSPWTVQLQTALRDRTGMELRLLRRDDVWSALLTGRLDLALVRTKPPSDGFQLHLLGTEPRVAVVASRHQLAGRESLAWAELRRHPLVVNTVSGTTTAESWPEEQRPSRVLTCANYDEWIELVASGQGVGALPLSAADARQHPGLRTIALEDAPQVSLWLAHRRGLAEQWVGKIVELARAMPL
ncbi:LysR family transcriptional regulator [Luteococcus sp. Sow4_B9]|uniref:LysR family transcriptional regulator n=1 Tax=Luteococcus sp. Sow4_B9 TaxID=3438792 RepID=UPI003F9C6628